MSDEATETTETEAPEVQEAAADAASQESSTQEEGPDLTDALSQLNAAREAFESAQPQADENETLGALFGTGEDWGEEEQQQADATAQTESPLADAEQWVDGRIQEAVQGYAMQQELSRRAEGVQKLVEDTPQIRENFEAIDEKMRRLDPNYGREGYVPDPEAVRTAWLAIQAEQAQTSSESEGSGEASAEADGSRGPVLETGAGPGAPPEEMDPVEKAYHQALGGGKASDPFGFPTQ